MKENQDDRHGFQVPTQKEKKKQAAEIPEDNHPAWLDFTAAHKPAASKADATVLLTTAQLLEQLNNACDSLLYGESWLFRAMKALDYKLHQVPGTDLQLWMIGKV